MRNRMSKQNKEKILKSFFKLLEEKPYSEITIVDISIYASVSRKTFYRLFKNKENLLNTYIDQLLNDWVTYANKKNPQNYEDLITLLFEFWKRYVPQLTILVNANLSSVILNKFNSIFPQYFMDFHNQHPSISYQGNEYDSIQMKYIALLSVGSLWNAFSTWLINPTEISLSNLAALAKNNFLYTKHSKLNSELTI